MSDTFEGSDTGLMGLSLDLAYGVQPQPSGWNFLSFEVVGLYGRWAGGDLTTLTLGKDR